MTYGPAVVAVVLVATGCLALLPWLPDLLSSFSTPKEKYFIFPCKKVIRKPGHAPVYMLGDFVERSKASEVWDRKGESQ